MKILRNGGRRRNAKRSRKGRRPRFSLLRGATALGTSLKASLTQAGKAPALNFNFDTLAELQDAIQMANASPAADDIAISGTITLTGLSKLPIIDPQGDPSIVIHGSNSSSDVVDGGNVGRNALFFVRSGNVVIRNSTFEDNLARGGESEGEGPAQGTGKGGATFALHSLAAKENGNNQGMPPGLPTVTGCGNEFLDNSVETPPPGTDTDNNDTFGTSRAALIEPCPTPPSGARGWASRHVAARNPAECDRLAPPEAASLRRWGFCCQ